MKKITFILILFQSILLVAQSNQKLDRKFQVLLQNTENAKLGRMQKSIPSPFKLDEKISSKAKGTTKYSCIIYTENPQSLIAKGIEVQSILPKFVTALVSVDDLKNLSIDKNVNYVESPEIIEPHNDLSVANSGAGLLHAGMVNNTSYKGKGVIVAVFDSGIDWRHPDFRQEADQTQSRILRIWDQTITPIGAEASPAGFAYGVEYTQAHINDELDGAPAGFVREADTNGHGTHVAGTAAGNGMGLASKKHAGFAPEADIVFIKGGNGSFPTTNTVDALTYLTNLANEYNRPVVLNMSIGGQFGPHDGTRPHEQAVDAFTNSGSGRVVVISAGNDNGTNLHKRDVIASGANATTTFVVPSNTAAADFFAYRVYVNDNTNITAVATAPGGQTVTALVGQESFNSVVGGAFTLYVDNLIDAANGDRYAEIYLERNAGFATDVAGNWTLTLTNNGAAPITTDGWLYYRATGVSTTITGGDNISLVGSPGNATNAITAASYVGRIGWYTVSTTAPGGYTATGATQEGISTFSAIGPRRDGVQKPDIAGMGQNVISSMSAGSLAATSTDNIDGVYYRKNQGTSMSSPAVAGAVALLLQAKPDLTFAQVKTLLRNNAQTDVSTGAVPNTTWGFGKLDVYKAASAALECAVPNRNTLLYETPYQSASDGGIAVGVNRIGVNFTPNITGKLGGVYFSTSTTAISLTSFTIEVRQNNAGNPGALIASKAITPSSISRFSWNYYDLTDLNVNVTNGTDYFIILYGSGASGTWAIRRDNTNVDNRSRISTDSGVTWTTPALDYRIRSVVYESTPQISSLVSATSTDEKIFASNTSYNFTDGCGLIGTLLPNGGTPVSGKTSAKAWIEGAQSPDFVKRHYEITPATNTSTATGKVTLYFTQQEFNDYNAASPNDLPVSSTDAAGIANLRIQKYDGTSTNNTGLPNSYTGSNSIIDPVDSDIVWDSTYNYWKVSFNVTGFSGFFAKGDAPLGKDDFNATKIAIYPNPTKDFVTVDLVDEPSAKVDVYDSVGRLVKKQSLNAAISQVNIADLPSGIYIFNVITSQGKVSKQIMKM
jgi:minor extracellular serine protease Vpr